MTRRHLQPSFLDKVDLFLSMDKYDKLRLLDMLNTKTLNQGEYVFREGDAGDNFYMIVEGTVECLKNTLKREDNQ